MKATTKMEASYGRQHTQQQPYIKPEQVTQLFEKMFHFQRNGEQTSWKLPPANELFTEYYQFESLQQLREHLNGVKSKLNDYSIEDWSAHTRRKDPAGEIPWRLKNQIKAEFITVAWCKFFECLHRFPLVQRGQLNTLHLCEAPGAFIAALNHYLYTNFEKDEVKWKWLSTTLNPYYEGNDFSKTIIDHRFILHTLDNWLFHEDFTGNIMRLRNIESMQEQCVEKLNNCVQLVTADGSVDCVEVPDCQEEYVAPLHFAEILTALCILAEGGCFLLKMFTLFEASSVSTMYLLNCIFEAVHVFKPATSRRGNSEVYVICLGYKRQTQHLAETLELMKCKLNEGQSNVLPIFAKMHIPAEFLQQHEICARRFMKLQIDAIEENIYTYEIRTWHDTRRSHLLRTKVCDEFYRRYKIQPIEEQLTILQQQQLKNGYNNKIYKGTYSEREQFKATTMEAQVFMLRGELNELDKTLSSEHQSVLLNEANANSIKPNSITKASLKLYKGAPYAKLQLSLFASVHALVLRIKMQNIFNIDPIWHNVPKCVLDDGIATVQLDLEARHNCMQMQRKFFVDILTALLEQQPQRMDLHDFPFLTHFSVSILRYLTLNVFADLCITATPTCLITLRMKEHKYDPHTLETLAELRDLLTNDMHVLCIMDIAQLHHNAYCKALTTYNNLLLLQNCKLILDN